MPKPKLELVEVSPRDGLQNEPELVSTADKLKLIDLILKAGFTRLEAGSFVNPKKVPQMADSPEVFAGLPKGGATFIALALNAKGLERAIEAGAKEVNYVFCASDEFSIRNNGGTVAETLVVWPDVVARAKAAGVRVSAVISTAFGCPFEGEVPVARVVQVAEQINAVDGVFELTLADTIGVAAPSDVTERFKAIQPVTPKRVQLRAHFHNTRNTALANAVAAVEAGVTILDGSLAGVGGCPFAPGAAGNVPTEDLIYMFERMGFDTGVDLDAAIEAARFVGGVLGKQTPGMVSRAGGFPKRSAAAS